MRTTYTRQHNLPTILIVENGQCPTCGSTNILRTGYTHDLLTEHMLLGASTCADCNSHWRERYETHLEAIEFLGSSRRPQPKPK